MLVQCHYTIRKISIPYFLIEKYFNFVIFLAGVSFASLLTVSLVKVVFCFCRATLTKILKNGEARTKRDATKTKNRGMLQTLE